MKITAFIVFILVLFFDLYFKFKEQADTLLGWGEIFLMSLVLFVAFGDRIVKFVLGKDGLTIEQTFQKQAEAVKEDLESIQALERADDPKSVDRLLSRATGQNKDVWSKMVIYRLTMRVLLRRVCSLKGMRMNDTTAFVSMLEFLQREYLLTPRLREEIEFVRDRTFFFEWGTGIVPSTDEIRRALELAPKVIKDLESTIMNLEQVAAEDGR